jgi:hypothetical protein
MSQDIPGYAPLTPQQRGLLGGLKAMQRLKALGYDPIKRLVEHAKEIDEEIEYQRKLRKREIVELTPTGRERSFRVETLLSLLSMRESLNVALLRYSYARVPENYQDSAEIKDITPKYIVNLTKDNAEYQRLALGQAKVAERVEQLSKVSKEEMFNSDSPVNAVENVKDLKLPPNYVHTKFIDLTAR